MKAVCRRIPVTLVWLIFGLAISLSAQAQVVINEILAANRLTNSDEEGDPNDWVELYNAGESPVNLAGYSLTDDPGDPQKWTFSDFTLGAGEYLLVWCSDKDRDQPPVELITLRSSPVPFVATILTEEQDYRYMQGDPADGAFPDGWAELGFDDAAWQSGKPGFGFGDDDDRTILEEDRGAALLRTEIDIPDLDALPQELYLQAYYDDGFVLFVNGERVLDVNVDEEDLTLDFDTFSERSHEAHTRDAQDWRERWSLDVAAEHWRTGANVIAFVLLNRSLGGNDLTLLPEMGTIPKVFHTNFRLAIEGEDILLVDPELNIVDAVNVPVQIEDRSYGRSANDGGEFRYLLTPTPGAENNTLSSTEPISQRPEFDPPPGEFSDDVLVTMTVNFPFDVELRYTTNGSVPTATSSLYEGPVDVPRTRVLRAAAFSGGDRVSLVTTGSYLLGVQRYDLPIMSIGMDPTAYQQVHTQDGRGRTSEREGHVEVFERDGKLAVATGMGLRLHGGAGRGGDFNIKKAYKMYFRSQYGDPKLRYPLIPETEIDVFDKLVLRANFNDAFRTGQQAALIRDEVIRRLQQDMGGLNAHGAWYNLFVNGRFRGVYNIVERTDKEFFNSYFPETEEDDWFVVKTGDDLLDGGSRAGQALNAMKSFFRQDMRNPDVFERVGEFLNVENYTRYMLLNIWAQNHDWPHNNWYMAKPPGEPWIFLSWDAEFGIGRIPGGFRENTVAHVQSRNGTIAQPLNALLRNTEYQKYFLEQADLMFNGPLSAENVLRHVREQRDIVRPDITEEARLPSPSGGFGTGTWETNVRAMESFGNGRVPVIRSFIFNASAISLARVTRVSPARVTLTAEPTEVTLTGRGFRDVSRFFFNDVEAVSVEFERSTRVKVVLPYDTRIEGRPTVRVETPDIESLDAEGVLTVNFERPSLQGLFPDQGSSLGGEQVIVAGGGFVEPLRVEFGGAEATDVTLIDSNTLRVTTPPGSGTVDVRVVLTGPGELVSESTLPFLYEPDGGFVFRRGDATGDGRVNVTDGVTILRYLFAGRGDAPCRDAFDTDDSGAIDLADAIRLLNALFVPGSPPTAPPNSSCGPDPTADDLECERKLLAPRRHQARRRGPSLSPLAESQPGHASSAPAVVPVLPA